MTNPTNDIVAIGDAIVDVIATCEDALLDSLGLTKGSMRLLDSDGAVALYAKMGPAREISGGSAANSMAGVAAMGGSAAFIGQVGDDDLGRIFAHDIQSLGVRFDTAPLEGAAPTGRCLILVTPDGQRTMNTCAGASHLIADSALDVALIERSAILYLEGYFWGPERPRAFTRRAMEIARRAGRAIAFTVSDSIVIPRYRDAFAAMIEEGGVDLLFANQDEALRLTGRTDPAAAIAELSAKVPTLIVTRGAAGASATRGGETVTISAQPVERVVDTTGAGDLFAAGFLVAHNKGAALERCLTTGAIAAAEVIGHFGARPEADLTTLIGL